MVADQVNAVAFPAGSEHGPRCAGPLPAGTSLLRTEQHFEYLRYFIHTDTGFILELTLHHVGGEPVCSGAGFDLWVHRNLENTLIGIPSRPSSSRFVAVWKPGLWSCSQARQSGQASEVIFADSYCSAAAALSSAVSGEQAR